MKNKNIGHIYVDDGYPESADYDNNYISYEQDEPGGYANALKEVRTQLPVEKLNAPELPARSASALRLARSEKNDTSRVGHHVSNTLRLLKRLLGKWRRHGRGQGSQSSNCHHGLPRTQAGISHFGKRHAFSW